MNIFIVFIVFVISIIGCGRYMVVDGETLRGGGAIFLGIILWIGIYFINKEERAKENERRRKEEEKLHELYRT